MVSSRSSPSRQNNATFLSTHLSTFDDYLTVILVDLLYFWIDVHKVHPSRRPPRGPSPAVITDLLRKHSYDSGTMPLLKDFLALPSIKSYILGHAGTPRLVHEFESHARRYLSMYLLSVSFELGTTERYRAVSQRSEACIIARNLIEAGITINHLTGKMVALSSQDQHSINRDFSIIYSHRLGESCLMLGPCRFVNHDCDPNCHFVAQGGSGVVAVVSNRRIYKGEEITVGYADNYFGTKNRECMCATCERKGRGFFGAPRPNRFSRSSTETSQSTNSSDELSVRESSSEDDFSDQSEADSEGVKLHRTRSQKRRRLELMESRSKSTACASTKATKCSVPLQEENYDCPADAKSDNSIDNSVLGLQFSEARRRSSRIIRRVSTPIKRDYEDVTRPVGCNSGHPSDSNTGLKSRFKKSGASSLNSGRACGRKKSLRSVQTNLNYSNNSRCRLASLPTPPLSASWTNSDSKSIQISNSFSNRSKC